MVEHQVVFRPIPSNSNVSGEIKLPGLIGSTKCRNINSLQTCVFVIPRNKSRIDHNRAALFRMEEIGEQSSVIPKMDQTIGNVELIST